MRKLIACLLVTTLVFPWEAFAQTATTVSPASVNHPAFAALLSDVQKTDSAGIDYPVISDPATGAWTIQHGTLTALKDAQSNPNLVAGCNPVVWASMVQKSQQRLVRDTALAMGVHNTTPASMNNKCTTNLGKNGEDRTAVEAAVRSQTEAMFSALESAVCTLNFSALLKGLVGGSVSVCKNGKVFSSNLSQSLSSTFLANGQDPFKSKNCATPSALSTNMMKQVSGTFGAAALNGSNTSSLGYSTAGTIPTGSGFTLGIGLGGGSNGLGVSTTVGNTTSTTNIVGTTSSSVPSSSGSGTPTPVTPTSGAASTPAAQNIFK